jgi:hypothetical protein
LGRKGRGRDDKRRSGEQSFHFRLVQFWGKASAIAWRPRRLRPTGGIYP